jgi:cyclophilin family peptidyl-prolyl cis-trans isomerase
VDIFTAGPSGNPANSDHVQQPATVSYDNGPLNRIIITATLPAPTSYEVVVKGTQIKDVTDSKELDGEFNGSGNPSGNGVQGGTYRFVTQISAGKVAIYSFAGYGQINVKLATKAQDSATITNFLHYANQGLWDQTFINRSITPGNSGLGIVQGGSYTYDPSSNQLGQVTSLGTFTPEPNDFGNVTDTLAMAMSGGRIASNAWFFNAVSNPSLDTPTAQSVTGGYYDAFGIISNPGGAAVLAQIYALPSVDISPQVTGSDGNLEFENVPTSGPMGTADELDSNFAQYDVQLTRLAIKMAADPAVATPFIAAAAAAAPFAATNLQYASAPDQASAGAGTGDVGVLDAPSSVLIKL